MSKGVNFYLQSFKGWNMSDKVVEESLNRSPVDTNRYLRFSESCDTLRFWRHYGTL